MSAEGSCVNVRRKESRYLLSAGGETGNVDGWSSGGKEAEQEDEQEVKERHLVYGVRWMLYRWSGSERC